MTQRQRRQRAIVAAGLVLAVAWLSYLIAVQPGGSAWTNPVWYLEWNLRRLLVGWGLLAFLAAAAWLIVGAFSSSGEADAQMRLVQDCLSKAVYLKQAYSEMLAAARLAGDDRGIGAASAHLALVDAVERHCGAALALLFERVLLSEPQNGTLQGHLRALNRAMADIAVTRTLGGRAMSSAGSAR